MKVKKIKVPVEWKAAGTYEFTFPVDMPEEEAIKAAIKRAENEKLPDSHTDSSFLLDSLIIHDDEISINNTEEDSFCLPDLAYNDNPMVKLTCRVKLNRGLRKGEVKSFYANCNRITPELAPFGLMFTFNDYTTEAGFVRNGEFTPDEEGDHVIVTETNLNTEMFPEVENITPEMLRASRFDFASVGFYNSDDLMIEYVEQITVTFKDGSDVYFIHNDLKDLNYILEKNRNKKRVNEYDTLNC